MKRLTVLALALVGSLCGYSQIIEYPKHQVDPEEIRQPR